MTYTRLAAALSLALCCAHAHAEQCRSNPPPGAGQPTACLCGKALARIAVTLPKGLVLAQACNLRRPDGSPVDLRQARISLDHYDASGNTFDGIYLLKGRLRLSGEVRYEPSDGGDLWFLSSTPLLKQPTAFSASFSIFALRQAHAYAKFGLSQRLRAKSLCARARAQVVLRDFDVIVNDSDEAGISPRSITVERVSDFSPCPPQ